MFTQLSSCLLFCFDKLRGWFELVLSGNQQHATDAVNEGQLLVNQEYS